MASESHDGLGLCSPGKNSEHYSLAMKMFVLGTMAMKCAERCELMLKGAASKRSRVKTVIEPAAFFGRMTCWY